MRKALRPSGAGKSKSELHTITRVKAGEKERRPKTLSSLTDSGDPKRMQEAIKEAKLSRSEDARPHPTVGVVLVTKDGKVVKGHRGEKRQGDHAEYTVLDKKLALKDLTGATLYTTLEPCTTRQHPKISCAERILNSRVGKVWIGMLDPNPDIWGQGIRLLDEAKVDYDFFPQNLRDEIKRLNKAFIHSHTLGSQLKLRYYSSATVNNVSYVLRQHISSLLWGEKTSGPSYNDAHLQYERVQAVIDSGKCSGALGEAETLFPRYTCDDEVPSELHLHGHLGEDDPVGLRWIKFDSTLWFVSQSSNPVGFIPRAVKGYLPYQDWMGDDLRVAYEVAFETGISSPIQLGPRDHIALPVTAVVYLVLPEGWISTFSRLKLLLQGGQEFREFVLRGVSGLVCELDLLDGRKVLKEFGLRIVEPQRVESISTINAEDFLMKWKQVQQAADDLLLRRPQQS